MATADEILGKVRIIERDFRKMLACNDIRTFHYETLGSDTDTNVRAFWNWRFIFRTRDVGAIKATLPNTVRYMQQAADVPLSSTLCRDDCDHLVTAVRKFASAHAGRP